MTFATKEQGIAFVTFQDFLHAVTNSPVGAVHMTGNNKENSQCQVVVSRICQPKSTGEGIQSALEGEEVGVYAPVKGKEGS